MTFLWPAAWFLALLAIPVIIFYLIRNLPRRKPVSTLLFWDLLPARKRSSPLWRKLRRLFSLLLQLLFLFLLVLLLAQPLMPWQEKAAQSVIFIVDTNPSMAAESGGTSSLDRAKNILRTRIRALRATDEVLLIASGNPPRIIQRWTSNRKLLLEALEPIEVSGTAVSVAPALNLAADLASGEGSAKIAILTNEVGDEIWKKPTDASLEVISIPLPENTNYGLNHFSATRSRVDPETVLIHVRTTRSNPEADGDNFQAPRLELLVNDQLTDVIPSEEVAADSFRKTWSLSLTDAATLKTRLIAEVNDPLSSDDQAEVSIAPVENLSVYLVGPRNSFLTAVLSAMDQVTVEETAIDDLPSKPTDALFIFNQFAPPDHFRPAASLYIRPPGSGVWGTQSPELLPESIVSEWEENHDLLRHVDLDQVFFNDSARYEPLPAASIFAESFGDPLIFGEWEDENQWLATSFSLDHPDLVYRTVFPIFIGNLVRSLNHSTEPAAARLPGDVASQLRARPILEASQADSGDTPAAARPLFLFSWHHWILLLAIIWTLAEWHTYHRRITE